MGEFVYYTAKDGDTMSGRLSAGNDKVWCQYGIGLTLFLSANTPLSSASYFERRRFARFTRFRSRPRIFFDKSRTI